MKFIESKYFAIFAFLVLAVVLCKQAKADEHYGNFIGTQPPLEFVFDAALTADMLTTADIKNTRYKNTGLPYVETNPILGQRPSASKIAAYGAGMALLHAAITYEMVSQGVPRAIINVWEIIGIGVEAGYVAHNYKVGCKIKF